MDGIINIYKEKGYTSHDVVAIVRKTLGRVKAGHTGTLDPDAEGVLPVCIGKATKLSYYIMADEKAYRATVVLGVTTDTEDAQGTVLATTAVTCGCEEIEAAVQRFVGKYEQLPPMYSAIKINGQKLYNLAREGKVVERKRRVVTISCIKILEFFDNTKFSIEVTCGKGTYIRTLCADIGELLGCGAHMGDLLRIRSGGFTLENAVKLSALKELAADGRVESCLISIAQALEAYPSVRIDEAANKYLYNGNKINVSFAVCPPEIEEGRTAVLYDCKENVVGLYIFENNAFKPLTMLF